MATSYKELYNSVYSKIKDYDFIAMSEDEADEILHDYIRPAIVDFEDCKQDLSDRDETLKSFNIDLTDINFEILSNFMVLSFVIGPSMSMLKRIDSVGTETHLTAVAYIIGSSNLSEK